VCEAGAPGQLRRAAASLVLVVLAARLVATAAAQRLSHGDGLGRTDELSGHPEEDEARQQQEGQVPEHGAAVTRQSPDGYCACTPPTRCRASGNPASRSFWAAPCEPRPGELRSDMCEAEFGQEGDLCTFEVLVRRMGLDDPALVPIAAAHPEDEDRLQRASAWLADLYVLSQRR
jgi:hypothetical protein